MNIFDTPLGSDVAKILNQSGGSSLAKHLRMEWIIPGADAIPVRRIHGFETVRDYRDASFDSMTSTIEVTVEQYMKYLYPHRAELLLRLYVTEASHTGEYKDNSPVGKVYKVFLQTAYDHELFDQTFAGVNEREKSNNVLPMIIELIDYELYKIKNTRWAAVLGKGKIEDYLQYFMSIRGRLTTNIHPIDNQDDAEDIVIPEGIDVIDLANWFQSNGPGLYNHGINTYYQDGIMSIYPVALLEPHPKRMKVNIFRSGNEISFGTGNTYAVIEGSLNLISAGMAHLPEGERHMIDDREMLEQEYGNAVRWNDPRYQSNVVDETDDQMRYTSRNSHIYGLSDVDIKVEKIHKRHTANPYYQRSIINKTLGRIITIPWNNGNSNLILPGTEVTYYYMKGRSMESVQGVIEGTKETLVRVQDMTMKDVFDIQTILRLRVQ